MKSTTLDIAGRGYAEGRLTIDEVAAVLELDVADAVARLESQDFRRSLDGLPLSETRRAAKLQSIRADRLARANSAHFDDELVRRDVAASQRIEGVDARPWLVR